MIWVSRFRPWYQISGWNACHHSRYWLLQELRKFIPGSDIKIYSGLCDRNAWAGVQFGLRPRTCFRQAAKDFYCITRFTFIKAGSKMQNVKIHSKAHKSTSSAKARGWSSCLWMVIAMTCVRRVQWEIRWGRWPVHRQGCTRAWPCSPLIRWRWCCRWKGSIWCRTQAWCGRSPNDNQTVKIHLVKFLKYNLITSWCTALLFLIFIGPVLVLF